MPTRQALKKNINEILQEETKGLHTDEYWLPVYSAFRAVAHYADSNNILFVHTNNRYNTNKIGIPISKTWFFEILRGNNKKTIRGILTAHGAGSVEDPLAKYDISAYVS